jgi:pilus assembly protein FimV
MKRLPSRCALALAIGIAFAAPVAHGAGLGRISVQSALGQPLRAEVEVTGVSREEAATLAARLASAAAFQQANLEFNPALTGLRVTLDRRGETNYVIRLSSQAPVSEPYLDLLLELTSSAGRVVREYTILLDPPALRAAAEVVAPAARPAGAPPASAQAAPAPAAAPRESAAQAAPAAGGTYAVQRGDTLGSIAQKTRPASASLDQMLVALFRANPGAFIGGNMNNLRADAVLAIPAEPQVLATDAAAARREVAAQSADFARYRSRLAQAATGVAAEGGAIGQGRVTARVEDRAAPEPSGDKLKIAQPPPAARAGDEAVIRDRQIQDLLDRVAELERANQQLQKALELQSKTGAQVQAAAEGKPAAPSPSAAAPGSAAAPTAPAAGAPSAPPAASAPPVAVAPAAPAPMPAAPPPAQAPKASAPSKAAPPPAQEPGFLSGLLGDNTPMVAGLGVALVGLVGLWAYRRRAAARREYELGVEAVQANSLFGQSGGRSIDTAATSTFNSSFIPAATHVDSTEVDPVAEADVYIAYGREEQAEDILKEALRVEPDRHAARVKMMEILANRGDKAGFARHAAELRSRTGGVGEDWERAAAIGRAFDPSNPMFAAAAAAATAPATSGREAMTDLQLGPATREALNMAAEGAQKASAPPTVAAEAARGPATAPKAPVAASPTTGLGSTLGADSQLGGSTVLPLEGKSTLGQMTVPATTRPQREGVPTALSDLEFEAIPPPTQFAETARTIAKPAAPLDYDLELTPATTGAATQLPRMPDIDLNLTPPPAPTPSPATVGALDFDLPPLEKTAPAAPVVPQSPPVVERRPAPMAPAFDETLVRPTLLGDLTALPEGATRLPPNTDQATVPLIDFDLSGADVPLNTAPGKAGAPTGSPLAAQIATKLDLARGYIDLGVKDGARELLEEVMREGTREQRQSAIELIKQLER